MTTDGRSHDELARTLTLAQKSALRQLARDSWADREDLEVRGPTLAVLHREGLAESRTLPRVPPRMYGGFALNHINLWRLTRRGLKVRREL